MRDQDAAWGMGRAIAHRLAGDDFMVVVNYSSSPNAAEGVFQEIDQDGGNAIAIQVNVSECVDVERLFMNMPARFGRIDCPGRVRKASACGCWASIWLPRPGTPQVARKNPPRERFLDELRRSRPTQLPDAAAEMQVSVLTNPGQGLSKDVPPRCLPTWLIHRSAVHLLDEASDMGDHSVAQQPPTIEHNVCIPL